MGDLGAFPHLRLFLLPDDDKNPFWRFGIELLKPTSKTRNIEFKPCDPSAPLDGLAVPEFTAYLRDLDSRAAEQGPEREGCSA